MPTHRVAKAEMLLQDDGEVSKLEEECNWFRNETNRLQTHSATMQHDIHVRSFDFPPFPSDLPHLTGFADSSNCLKRSESIPELPTQSCNEAQSCS
jgi:hypothetical protein